jgi:hypothetical protein
MMAVDIITAALMVIIHAIPVLADSSQHSSLTRSKIEDGINEDDAS